jgi:hypothetical protein
MKKEELASRDRLLPNRQPRAQQQRRFQGKNFRARVGDHKILVPAVHLSS